MFTSNKGCTDIPSTFSSDCEYLLSLGINIVMHGFDKPFQGLTFIIRDEITLVGSGNQPLTIFQWQTNIDAICSIANEIRMLGKNGEIFIEALTDFIKNDIPLYPYQDLSNISSPKIAINNIVNFSYTVFGITKYDKDSITDIVKKFRGSDGLHNIFKRMLTNLCPKLLDEPYPESGLIGIRPSCCDVCDDCKSVAYDKDYNKYCLKKYHSVRADLSVADVKKHYSKVKINQDGLIVSRYKPFIRDHCLDKDKIKEVKDNGK